MNKKIIKVWIKYWVIQISTHARFFCNFYKILQIDVQKVQKEHKPIFIIGANRSGTSVVSSVLSQHPEVEGLFSGEVNSVYTESGHSLGFCESMHIWRHLMPSAIDQMKNDELPYWGSPEYVGKLYRKRIGGNWQKKCLIWDVLRHRITTKHILIKNQVNLLRIGFIKELFPEARFVYVVRPINDFIKGGLSKWFNDMGAVKLSEQPMAGFQWILLNTIASYELEANFPNNNNLVWLDEIQVGNEESQKIFFKLTEKLNLIEFNFDFSIIKGGDGLNPNVNSHNFPIPVNYKDVINYEKSIIGNLNE
jgi:hypothetical protein